MATQPVHLGIKLIKKCNDFEKRLTTQFHLPTLRKIWLDFKAHFEGTSVSLRRVRRMRMRNTAFHNQANAIKNQVLQESINDRLEVLNEVKETETKHLQALQLSRLNKESKESYPQANTNVISGNKIQVEMMKTIKSLKRKLYKMKKSNSTTYSTTSTDNENNKKEEKEEDIPNRYLDIQLDTRCVESSKQQIQMESSQSRGYNTLQRQKEGQYFMNPSPRIGAWSGDGYVVYEQS